MNLQPTKLVFTNMHSSLRIVTSQIKLQHVTRLLHTTSTVSIDYKWRRSQRLPDHVRREPEFRDSPDVSFLDGRPMPLGQALKKRHEDEMRLCADAVKYIGQIDYALKREQDLIIEAEERARQILGRKLMPKGPVYKPKHTKESS